MPGVSVRSMTWPSVGSGIGGIDDQQLVGLPELGQQGADRGVEDAAFFHGTYPLTSQARCRVGWASGAFRVPGSALAARSGSAPALVAWKSGVASSETLSSITIVAALLHTRSSGRPASAARASRRPLDPAGDALHACGRDRRSGDVRREMVRHIIFLATRSSPLTPFRRSPLASRSTRWPSAGGPGGGAIRAGARNDLADRAMARGRAGRVPVVLGV